MSDRIVPIHTGCSRREELAFYVEGFMTAVWLIVEHHLAALYFAEVNEPITDVLVRKQYRFYLRDDSENGWEPCPACGRRRDRT